MSMFTMINRSTKEIGEEKFFNDYSEAGRYCKEHYGEGWEAKHEPFHFESEFYKFVKSGSHPSIKIDKRGRAVVIANGNTAYHCGFVTFNDIEMMRRAGITPVSISKREFIEMHNELLTSTLN